MPARRAFCVTDLAAVPEIEQSTLSHRLREMRAFYRLDGPHVRSLFEQGLAHIED